MSYKKKAFKVTAIFFVILLYSCMDQADLQVKIINETKNEVYVGELTDCDSCNITQDVRGYCNHGAYKNSFPKVVEIGDRTVLFTKYFESVKIYAINKDSLDKYCNHPDRSNLLKKTWVRVLNKDNINPQNKMCTFVIR